VKVSANAASESKLLARRRMNDMKWTFFAHQLRGFGTSGTFWQFHFWNVGEPLKVIVACVAEVSGAEAEKHCHRTAIAAFILEEIHTVFWAHLMEN
jgi:hypothetical protein